ncbi:MAG: STAS domain-containing protein [Clostridia bacterium]|nr:STAS domain-containing protein [Clostridia bacterium]
MTINKTQNDNSVTLAIVGRLDTTTAPDLEKEIDNVGEIKELIIDMKELEYTSSAGLRALLKAQKMMNEKGKMKVINVNETIMEVFDITGFSDMLTIE